MFSIQRSRRSRLTIGFLLALGFACHSGDGQFVTVAEDSAIFKAGLEQLRASGEMPQFVDPRPAALDSLARRTGLASDTTPEIVASRTRILSEFGVTPKPFQLDGPCAGALVRDERRKIGCPTRAVIVADIGASSRRGDERILGVAVRLLGPTGSATAGRRYVFKRTTGKWTLVRVEPGMAID